MAIMYRCTCKKFYSLEYKQCPACKSKVRSYYLVYRQDGKQVRTKAGDSIQEAKQTEAKLISEPKKLKQSNLILSDFVEIIFKPYYLSKNKERQIKSNTNLLNRILAQFPDKKLTDYVALDFDSYLQLRHSQGIAQATRNNELALLKHIFNYAAELEHLLKSPIKAKKQNPNNARTRYLSNKEQATLLEACRLSKSPYLFDIVFVALNTGMRAGEIRLTKKKHIFNNGFLIPAENTKSGKKRYMPFNAAMIDFTKDYLSKHKDFDFDHDIKKSFTVALRHAEIKDCTFHDLRHTFASSLINAGVSFYVVGELLGHSTQEVTKRYSHLRPDTLQEAVNVLNL